MLAIENEERFGAALRRKLDSVRSLAQFPLYSRKQLQSQVLGSFIIYSRREYLFTERRERIARAAAARAAVIMQAKKADYKRAQLDRERLIKDIEIARVDVERKWLWESLTTVTKGTPKQRLRSLVERVCKFALADVASVFVWNEATENLILHTSYNWHNPQEGNASYKQGESWTGGIALLKEEVTVLTPELSRLEYHNRFYEEMIPPEHRIGRGGSEIKFGIRLAANDRLVGVMTIVYYKGDAGEAAAKDQGLKESLGLFARFVTLCVEAVKQDSMRRQMRQLLNTKDDVAQQMVYAAGSHLGWPAVVDALKDGFMVERVNFYRVLHNKKMELRWSSPRLNESPVRSEPVEPFGVLGDLVLRKQDVLIKSKDDPSLKSWPDREGIRSLYATPVVDSQGLVRGVIAYINRIKTADHPFEFLDNIERGAAKDVTHPIAATLEHLERTREFEELTHKLINTTKIGASGLFANVVMHNVMAPFSVISGDIDWLIKHPNSSEEERLGHLRRIQEQHRRSKRTIREAAQRGTPGVKRENLSIVVGAALKVLDQELKDAKIKPDFSGDAAVNVRVDSLKLVGALVSLLTNAVEAMKGEKDAKKIFVLAQASSDGGTAFISIRNPLPEVTEAQVVQFFEPKYTSKKGHLGLGVPLAQRTIEEAGGKLEIKPHPLGGVETIVTIPIC